MEKLQNVLRRIDGRGYRAYKDLQGEYHAEDFDLFIDHVQGDPYAAPSRIALVIGRERAGLPESLWRNPHRRIATEDYLTRCVARGIQQHCSGGRGSGKSGQVSIDRPGQEVLERTSCLIDGGGIEVRLEIGLPADGRRVLARQAEAVLCRELPALVAALLTHDLPAMTRHADAVEDQRELRQQLSTLGLVSFVAEGALLPRTSGVEDRPMQGGVPFGPIPETLLTEVQLTSGAVVRGLGIPRGVTLVVGGGYHGKSTLLEALARGVYDHIPGDGRELVVTDSGAVTVRAEDGRRVEKVDIRAFIGPLPGGADTRAFSTDRASGSTSQAAGIMESIEAGATALLLDEDTSASNFLGRDARMQRLVPDEPICPLVDRVGQLARERDVSTVLVLGGSSAFFEVADHVIQMESYRPVDVTETVVGLVAAHPSPRQNEATAEVIAVSSRVPLRAGLNPEGKRGRQRVKSHGTRSVQLGEEEIDISLLSQLVDPSQARTLADALLYVWTHLADDTRTVSEITRALHVVLTEQGVCGVAQRGMGNRAAVRALDVAAVLNRLRSLTVAASADT